MEDKQLAIFQNDNGAIELSVDARAETIWANQAQIASLFDIDQSGVARHIKKVIVSDEVDAKSNMQKMHIANSDRPTTFYSLDVILAVGYRANSGKATQFRKWATTTLKSYVADGFVINPAQLKKVWSTILYLLYAHNYDYAATWE